MTEPATPAPVPAPAPPSAPAKTPTPEPLKHSPLLRNAVHAGAFLLCFVPFGMLVDPRNTVAHGRSFVVGFMIFVTLFNIFILPRLESGKRIARPGEGFVTGQWLYPASLAACFLIFPPFAAMGAWGAMAGGDAAASFVGRLLPHLKLPWNKDKSWAGMLGFIGVGFLFAWIAMFVCPSEQFLKKPDMSPELPFLYTLAMLAAVSGALLESLESPFDDNLRVPLGVAFVLTASGFFLSWATRDLPADTPVQPERFLHALGANAILGIAVLALKAADFPGTLLGVCFGIIIYFFAGWQGYLFFLLFVAIGSGLSRVGLKHKQEIGAAEEREGKRGLANVAANLAIPALCCLLYPVYHGHPALLMALAGSVAAAMADTASSEIGALSKSEPRLITSFRTVKHGTNGAITPLGMGAGAAFAAILAGVGIASGFFAEIVFYKRGMGANPYLCGLVIVAAGMVGTIVDSVLGATIEDRVRGVGKGVVNFACTVAGGLTAGLLALLLG
jgi:uncharacterized protein (TIGR00297 family)